MVGFKCECNILYEIEAIKTLMATFNGVSTVAVEECLWR